MSWNRSTAEGALAVGRLQVAALFQELQRDRGADMASAMPASTAPRHAEAETEERECGQRQGRDGQLRGAEPENRAAHGKKPRQLQFEADHEQQHHHAELGDGEDGGGLAEEREARRAR